MGEEFDAYAADYQEKIERAVSFSGAEHAFFIAEKARVLRRLLSTHFGDDTIEALDVGCGHGLIAPHMVSERLCLTGCDVAEQPLKFAAAAFPEATFCLQPEVRQLPFDDRSFHATYAICVMHHIERQDWGDFIKEMYRVTRSGGIVVIIEHNPLNPITQYIVRTCALDENATLVWPKSAGRFMKRAGLSAIALRYLLFTPFRASGFRAFDDTLGWVPFGAQYMVSGEKN